MWSHTLRFSALFSARALAVLVLLVPGFANTSHGQEGPPETAQATLDVELELVLAIDCSSSVDEIEYQLQMDGVARALADAAVIEAIETSRPRGIAISVVQWSGSGLVTQAIPWRHVVTRADALALSDAVFNQPRLIEGGATALGDAISFSVQLLESNAYAGRRRAIDVSGDGIANEGESPALIRHLANGLGITINGLPIMNEEPRLDSYYRAGVVGGPHAFMITAVDYSDFARAMRIKLLTEINGPPIANLGGPTDLQVAEQVPQ